MDMVISFLDGWRGDRVRGGEEIQAIIEESELLDECHL